MMMSMLNVAGGLAIFIFGMKLMSDGLHKAAGERMQAVLRFFSANRFIAILSGTVVTAVIQSSSATTVMVIGFINAGLLNLFQAIGIIFGANIGTTVTAQLVAFDIGWLIMPAIIIGLLLSFLPQPIWRGWGDTVIGFGFLFLGMMMMSDELKMLADHPAFMDIFRTFDCAPRNGWIPPGALFGAIGIGLAATLLIQSSSATAGIVIALGASGLVNLYTAVALVLGSNIGTTITAQLAAIPANRLAKQAALAHTLFNVIGVLAMVSTFWLRWPGTEEPLFFRLVNGLTVDGDLPRRIANAHTVFNVLTTLLLVGFIPLLARICETLIPIRTPKVKFQRLEPHLLATPPVALSQTVLALRRMLKKSWKMVDCALSTGDRSAEAKREMLKQQEKRELRLDEQQRDIVDYLAALMQRELSAAQAEVIPILLHSTHDAERIGEHTGKILELMTQLRRDDSGLSQAAEQELKELHERLNHQAEGTLVLLENNDPVERESCKQQADAIRHLTAEYETNHLKRLTRSKCAPASGVLFIEIMTEIRKVSNHLANIADQSAALQNCLIRGTFKVPAVSEVPGKLQAV